MALVGVLLIFLLLGIVAFGFLMAFRQNMVHAASEGARAGAVAASANIKNDAYDAAAQAISGFHACDPQDGSGPHTGLTCAVDVILCPGSSTITCVKVTLTYDYENYPLLPDVPLLGSFYPTTITSSGIAEVNYP